MSNLKQRRLGSTHRCLIKAGGFTDYDLSLPVVEVVNTWSEWNPGHQHLRQVSPALKRGILSAGGFPLEMNTLSLCPGETLPNRNMLAMEIESVLLGVGGLGAENAEAVAYITTCDKDVPALLMASARIDLPSIFVLGGSMEPGSFHGQDVGCCTDSQRLLTDVSAGLLPKEEYQRFLDECLAFPTVGACGILGTANTMQTMAEALGIAPPGTSTVPATSAMLYQNAEESGRMLMNLIKEDIKPRDIMTEKSVENAIRVLMAEGGSTNAIIHVLAIARMLDIDLSIERFDELSRDTPYLVDVKPSGQYMTVDYCRAGGVPALMKRLESLLNLDVMTVTGKTVGENLAEVKVLNEDIIRPLNKPLLPEGGLAILKGNLAPNGAVIKHSGSRDRNLLQHKGPAIIFEGSREEINKRLNDENLEVTRDHVLVFRYFGPKARTMMGPGAPPIPPKIARKGVRDMVRITDGRMSGTNYGTIILHVSPEAYVGGPLAAVEDGDIVDLDLTHRNLSISLTQNQIEKRLKTWKPPKLIYNHKTGPLWIWYNNCMQADKGCIYPFMSEL
jgi:dihydroxy-acid dehydratase